MEENNIVGCIAVQADQSEEETHFLLQCATEYPFIKGVVGWVNLMSDDVREKLPYFSMKKLFKGVRHILQNEEKDFVLQEKFQNGIACLSDFNHTYDILIYPYQIENVIQLVKKFPKQKFVLDHLAKPYIKSKKNKEVENRNKRTCQLPKRSL